MNICETCNKSFEKSSDIISTRFCCEHCRRVYIGRHSSKKRKNQRKIGIKINRVYSSKEGGWLCQQCGQIFRTRREKQKHSKENHKHRAWNFGLTKETSKAVAKSRETFMRRYKTGEIKKFVFSAERREKISEAVSKWLESDSYDTHFKRIKRFLVKNIDGVEYKCQGKWEKAVAEKLNSMGVKWVRGKPILYKMDGVTHRYNPDFYIPNEDRYVEVKGFYFERDRIKMRHVMEQNPELQIYFIDYKKYQSFLDGKIPFTVENFPVWW